MEHAQIKIRTQVCSRTFNVMSKQAALTHNVSGKDLNTNRKICVFNTALNLVMAIFVQCGLQYVWALVESMVCHLTLFLGVSRVHGLSALRS